MTIAFVQKGSAGTAYGAATATCTLAGTTAGHWLSLTVFWANPATASAPIAPSGWSTAVATAGQVCTGSASYHGGCSIFYKENIAGGSVSAIVNSGGSGAWALYGVIAEFSGVATSSSIDQTGNNVGTTGTGATATTSGSVGSAIALVIGCIAQGQLLGPANGLSDPPTTGYTSIAVSNDSNTAATGDAGYLILTAGSGTQSASWTWSATSEHGAAIATFLPIGGGPTNSASIAWTT